jgi:phage shock protein PspC (stress-responsive transcriptional regulator)
VSTRPPLVRSERDRVIAGVCAGLAEHLGLDVTLVRVAFVVFALFGPGLIAYVVLWIAVPKESAAPTSQGPVGAVPPPPHTPEAVRIAEERYARGEISAEELATIRSDLHGAAGP